MFSYGERAGMVVVTSTSPPRNVGVTALAVFFDWPSTGDTSFVLKG
jgi:hypothetical protein